MKTPLLDEQSRLLLGPTALVWPLVVEVLPPDAYLVGGTALALRLRHRPSYDLDLFSPLPYDTEVLSDQISRLARERRLAYHPGRQAEGCLFCRVGETKLDFVYQRPLLTEPPAPICGIPIAGLRDIAAMKVFAATTRAALRNRFDLMSLQQHTGWSHRHLFECYLDLYGNTRAAEVSARMCEWWPDPEVVPRDSFLRDVDGNPVEQLTNDYWTSQREELANQLSQARRPDVSAGVPTPGERHAGRPQPPKTTPNIG